MYAFFIGIIVHRRVAVLYFLPVVFREQNRDIIPPPHTLRYHETFPDASWSYLGETENSIFYTSNKWTGRSWHEWHHSFSMKINSQWATWQCLTVISEFVWVTYKHLSEYYGSHIVSSPWMTFDWNEHVHVWSLAYPRQLWGWCSFQRLKPLAGCFHRYYWNISPIFYNHPAMGRPKKQDTIHFGWHTTRPLMKPCVLNLQYMHSHPEKQQRCIDATIWQSAILNYPSWVNHSLLVLDTLDVNLSHGPWSWLMSHGTCASSSEQFLMRQSMVAHV